MTLIRLALPLVLIATPLQAETNIDRAFAEHVAAVQARDLKRLAATLTAGDQLELILPNGARTATKPAYLDFHRAFFAEKRLDHRVRGPFRNHVR